MPSYKPKVQVLLTQNYHDKFKELCDRILVEGGTNHAYIACRRY